MLVLKFWQLTLCCQAVAVAVVKVLTLQLLAVAAVRAVL
jgi:hypothetical protein